MSEDIPTDSYMIPGPPPPPPPPITLDDIMTSVEYIRIKEQTDKVSLESIGNMTPDSLKIQLIQWATGGFQNVYVIMKVTIQPPQICSDGVSRELTDYIQYCSGKSIQEHVQILQDKVVGINISFANFGSYIGIVVSNP